MPPRVRRYTFSQCYFHDDYCYLSNDIETIKFSKSYFECFFDLDQELAFKILGVGKKILLKMRNWYGLVRWPARHLQSQENTARGYLIKKRVHHYHSIKKTQFDLAHRLMLAQREVEKSYSTYEKLNCPTLDTDTFSKLRNACAWDEQQFHMYITSKVKDNSRLALQEVSREAMEVELAARPLTCIHKMPGFVLIPTKNALPSEAEAAETASSSPLEVKPETDEDAAARAAALEALEATLGFKLESDPETDRALQAIEDENGRDIFESFTEQDWAEFELSVF